MRLFDSLGVPLEPETVEHKLVGRDWRERPIYADDFTEYLERDGNLILDEPNEVYEYVKENFEEIATYDGTYIIVDGLNLNDDMNEIYQLCHCYWNNYYSTEIGEVI